MMTTNNTGNLRRSSVMPSKGQLYKKPMAKKKKTVDPFAEGIDPSAGRGVPLSAYNQPVPKPKPKPKKPMIKKKVK
jgi:hypothetical protein